MTAATESPSGLLPPLHIGRLTVETPVILAPMAGITNAAFRRLCRDRGAGLHVAERVTSRALVEPKAASPLIVHAQPTARAGRQLAQFPFACRAAKRTSIGPAAPTHTAAELAGFVGCHSPRAHVGLVVGSQLDTRCIRLASLGQLDHCVAIVDTKSKGTTMNRNSTLRAVAVISLALGAAIAVPATASAHGTCTTLNLKFCAFDTTTYTSQLTSFLPQVGYTYDVADNQTSSVANHNNLRSVCGVEGSGWPDRTVLTAGPTQHLVLGTESNNKIDHFYTC